MNTSSAPISRVEPPLPSHWRPADCSQPYIYSFRCSRGMEESLTRLMQERGLNRTSVIRLALYALDCFSRRSEVQELSLADFIEQLQLLEPGACQSFADFIRGK